MAVKWVSLTVLTNSYVNRPVKHIQAALSILMGRIFRTDIGKTHVQVHAVMIPVSLISLIVQLSNMVWAGILQVLWLNSNSFVHNKLLMHWCNIGAYTRGHVSPLGFFFSLILRNLGNIWKSFFYLDSLVCQLKCAWRQHKRETCNVIPPQPWWLTRDMGERCRIDADLFLTHAFFIILGELLNT